MKRIKRCTTLIFCFTIFLFLFVKSTHALPLPQPPTFNEARIISIAKSKSKNPLMKNITYQKIVFEFTDGPQRGKQVKLTASILPNALADNIAKNDKVIVSSTREINGKMYYQIVDYVRRDQLLLLFGIFLLSVFLIGRLQGALSFLGMLVSFYIIMNLVIPQILKGVNPIFITLIGSLFIIPTTFYLAHGLNRKTSIAVGSTFITLLITGILAVTFANLTRLTGYALEDAIFIESITGGAVNIKNLLLAGIIIGAMGVLDDITISQTSIVERLMIANPKFAIKELYFHAMAVGRDHIASLVNTLILVYAGASLPLFILFSDTKLPIGPILNQEIIATEIVRTLVSSIGIITAVPITTMLACLYLKRNEKK